ncbi:MAG: UDP-N-acetylmuramoyl-L-alanyl-D-glutamate--2,6-diaminopimelate ligase [Saprospiraceae bacterium]|nr:UDP-N-acetylmuramoyl-L-alanyl-D-glutamate--2,6-diaminopimelate ligase [Saprospiraceae bacterium]
MKELKDILTNIQVTQTIGNQDVLVANIAFDSRKVGTSSMFVAVKGTQVDGHVFIEKAITLGANVIVCEDLPSDLNDKVTYVNVENSGDALGKMAGNFYDNPSTKLKLVGITGTNGKTTCATILFKLFMGMGYKTGLLSTVENKIGNQIIPTTHTTPNPVELNELLERMVESGCDYVFMEVSSHAIEQGRVAGLDFDGGVFTNITHDHLDYHKTFKNYINAKKKFFDDLNKNAFALTNIDDRRGEVMLQNTKAKKHTYAVKKMADFKAKIVENSLLGLQLILNGKEFYSRLIGEFNAYNLLAVYGTATLLGHDDMEVLTVLSDLQSAEGRFDYIVSKPKNIVGIVDYAHTPDALEKVLMTINDLKTPDNQVITIVGCGGDRDKTKRPIMAKIACDYSDQVILTSDNPRTENPNTILEEMEKGIPPYATQKVLTIENRRQAIKTACALAKQNDIILVAGKGHEKYQDISGVKHHFDDKEELIKFLN